MAGQASEPPRLQARDLPKGTKVPLERATPLLACAVSKWLRAHGKTVRPKLTEEQKANLKTCFKYMDADGSGAIDAEELDAAFKLLGLSVSRREVEAMLAEVDRDGSGEVEYAEFLEIMTIQLAKLAEQKEAAASGRAKAAPASGGKPAPGAPPAQGRAGSADGDESQSEGAAAGEATAAAAAVLPFDLAATAYRRKKLMGALAEDDKEFILSVAAAEEEDKRRAEQEAATAARRGGHGRRSSVNPARPGSRRPSAAVMAGVAALLPAGPQPAEQPAPLCSHASFLDSLSKEERRVIDALSRKFREDREEGAVAQQAQRGAAAQPQHALPHLQALKAAGQTAGAAVAGNSAAGPQRQSSLRPASAAVTRPQQFHVPYRLGSKQGGAASAAAAAEGSSTQGLLLAVPQFSMQQLRP
ncbi:EF hand [Chlorella sorokiniana]|uniref:EF hand n=1 Tax=Chlorella sorokiniana TaxID=3076 RepID=A0A2P6U138_CHLSO|nr:EF hand [Chlorella sorokiniana]|eukprot:PRW60018.1 EF hand [Chlorella sorokiniana]